MKNKLTFLITLLLSSFITKSMAQDNQHTTNKSVDQKIELLTQAYFYGYPLLTMGETFKVSTNIVTSNHFKGKAPINQLACLYPFPKADFKGVVRPNLDTYYNIVYADLSEEPLFIQIPATKRYYLIPVLNAYTDVISTLGSRTTGQGELNIVLVGPNYTGDLPKDVTIIKSETNLNWLLGRVQVTDDKDGKKEVKNFANKIIVRPLSERNNKNYKVPEGNFKEENNFVPMQVVDNLNVTDYFNKMMALMVSNPPLAADTDFITQLKEVGITAGGTFDLSQFTAEEQATIQEIPAKAQAIFKQITARPKAESLQNGWFVTTTGLGKYGTNYAFRAYVTKIGFGANLGEDAVYPNTAVDVDGNLLNGSNKYILHFAADKLPPVEGFWSITMYDKTGFLVENSIDRYNLGDKKDMVYNKDGSLDIYIQKDAPKGHEKNWLPSTKEGVDFELTFRMYWPKEEVLNKTWTMPGIKKVVDNK
ncbi:DUF1254 domain-containing protein [Flammeovirga kamogawensis]|uniref:DUF1214 domain-containing protein n=1 Tax=Flammeovirga kamogawensis TaxID=373891 RepID=A0ABX8GQG6_9BACT|nr:DUF1214 domain-containing protein [Flammeovirga kamogawensis]MBB6463052.1 DNA sulfur modification protein DndE [Flammeovirga kamogawensis]QWG05689.1 DUF1214 domain-containing protein [Flammeovirga kamogawensis]TRX67517.1 DUF1254 domain-containing protein [Flammeovirga kamogawensis]